MPPRDPTPYVLVIDGYDTSRAAIVGELERRGLRVFGAAEEEDALAILAKHEGVRAVLLDLPLEEAIEAATAVRRTRRLGSAIVIAFVDPSVRGKARDDARTRGIDHFLLRPCPAAEIVKQLDRLSVRRARR